MSKRDSLFGGSRLRNRLANRRHCETMHYGVGITYFRSQGCSIIMTASHPSEAYNVSGHTHYRTNLELYPCCFPRASLPGYSFLGLFDGFWFYIARWNGESHIRVTEVSVEEKASNCWRGRQVRKRTRKLYSPMDDERWYNDDICVIVRRSLVSTVS